MAKLQVCKDPKEAQQCLCANMSKQKNEMNTQCVLSFCQCGHSILSGEAVGRAKERQNI